MKKLSVLLTLSFIATAFLITVPFALADGEANEKGGGKTKHWVCHRTSMISDGTLFTAISGSVIPEGDTVGQLILVSESSLPAHCKHGDREFNFDGAPFDPVRGLCRPDSGPGQYDVGDNGCPAITENP